MAISPTTTGLYQKVIRPTIQSAVTSINKSPYGDYGSPGSAQAASAPTTNSTYGTKAEPITTPTINIPSTQFNFPSVEAPKIADTGYSATAAKPGEFGVRGANEVISGLQPDNPLSGLTKEQIMSGNLGQAGVTTQATDALTRFLSNPTQYDAATIGGRSTWDLARERAQADIAADYENALETLRGRLAAQGITGPAAEEMARNLAVDFAKEEARQKGDITMQELAAQESWAQSAKSQAAGIASDIYSQGQDLSNKWDLAKFDAQTQKDLQNMKNQGAMNLQEQANKLEQDNKYIGEAAYNSGAADLTSGKPMMSDAEMNSLGFTDQQKWAYKSGYSGMKAENFQQANDSYSNAVVASILSGGQITQEMLDDIRSGIYSNIQGEQIKTNNDVIQQDIISNNPTYYNGNLVDSTGNKLDYNTVSNMFRTVDKYGDTNSELYRQLSETAPVLNLTIGNPNRNEFTSMPKAGSVFTVDGRPMIIKSTSERIKGSGLGDLGDYKITDYDGNVKTQDEGYSGREADTFVIVDLKTGKEQTFSATANDISRAMSINNITDWASGLGV